MDILSIFYYNYTKFFKVCQIDGITFYYYYDIVAKRHINL